jgi:cytochrome b pre-mRNA-processing protein 3
MTRLYGTIVAQARAETFYRDFGVPDTVNGRFEMIVLHAVLLLRRLDGDDTRGLGQALFDHFCGDMDGNLREMGIGDLGVPRQMRRIGEAFYGRKAAYGAALAAANDEALTTTLARNVFGAASAVASAERLAAYVAAAAEALAGQDAGALMRGDVAFPDPAVTMVRPEAAGERPGWDS